MAKICKSANNLILAELKKAGLSELSPSHGDILALLYNTDKISMHDIAKRIRRTKATTTVLIDKLENAGFVKREKSEEDSRFTNISLTKRGQDLKPTFEKISQNLNAAVYRNFTEQESDILESLLNKIQI